MASDAAFVASFVASPERLFSVREVAQRLNVSAALVYSLVEKGELEHVRVSHSIKVTPAALVRFIKGTHRRNE